MNLMTDNVTTNGAQSAHTLHIPVMGTAFTIDTALRIAKYGISTVISLVDDVLIEQMRKFHSEKEGEPYEEITDRDEDSRAKRITAYLNLVDRLVKRQVRVLQAEPFEEGSDITRYYNMLPETPLKHIYREMLATEDSTEKKRLQDNLRRLAVPGSIDVNIMTKLDSGNYKRGKQMPVEFNDAMAALRGYAKSTLSSSIVYSAGINNRLYTYTSTFDDFLPDENGNLKKKVILKVSDYRSSVIQGKFLAQRGLWVSEFRVESGLNCGGHAFISKGYLTGPILDEFKQRKQELIEKLHTLYNKTRSARGLSIIEEPYDMRITMQGGIGTSDENDFLLKFYELDGTGWATPFLLVPEVTNVDRAHLEKLVKAEEKDVYLSDSSPMGIPYWNLRNSASEETRRKLIKEGKAGSVCAKSFITFNTDYTRAPICTASRSYQKIKLRKLEKEKLTVLQLARARESVLNKSCICHDLAGSVTLKNSIDPDAAPSICCGPNIVYYSKIVGLEDMMSHIYGHLSLLLRSDRGHMFIKELKLFIDQLRTEVKELSLGLLTQTPKYYSEFKDNLQNGIQYYRTLAKQFVGDQRQRFLKDLEALHQELKSIVPTQLAATAEFIKKMPEKMPTLASSNHSGTRPSVSVIPTLAQ